MLAVIVPVVLWIYGFSVSKTPMLPQPNKIFIPGVIHTVNILLRSPRVSKLHGRFQYVHYIFFIDYYSCILQSYIYQCVFFMK